jgi:hypothetical protein
LNILLLAEVVVGLPEGVRVQAVAVLVVLELEQGFQ